ncbi:MAG: response regulator [Gemmataceae bacterium]
MTKPSPPRRLSGVLVVEDASFILDSLTLWLRRLGFTAFPARGCAEAEGLLREHAGEIDAALIDLRMPGADGLETRRRLDAVKPGLRCVLMTGAGLEADAPPEGFLLALAKPFGQDELETCLGELGRETEPV